MRVLEMDSNAGRLVCYVGCGCLHRLSQVSVAASTLESSLYSGSVLGQLVTTISTFDAKTCFGQPKIPRLTVSCFLVFGMVDCIIPVADW